DPRMERLDAAAEQLGHLRELLDARHLKSLFLQEFRRAAARDELDAELGEAARKRAESRLVVGGDQGTQSSPTTSGSNSCSTAWIRSIRVSLGSTGTGRCRRIGPLSTPSSTRWTVTPVISTPAASASSIGRTPGNSGSSDGWTLTT